MTNRRRLTRQATDAELDSLKCSKGWTPRKGKVARRERDCVIICTDYEACEKQNNDYWPEDTGKNQ